MLQRAKDLGVVLGGVGGLNQEPLVVMVVVVVGELLMRIPTMAGEGEEGVEGVEGVEGGEVDLALGNPRSPLEDF